jgi:hypothetical protein
MGVKDFTDGVHDLLAGGDAQFAGDIQQLLGVPVTRVLRANTPWAQIGANLLPCFVMEQAPGHASGWGTGEESGLVIGHSSQGFESELDVCVLWQQQDREVAADQRAQLPEIFVRLFLRNPQPGGINGAWVQEWMPDQGVSHPTQCWAARIRGNYEITRTP